jgi:hypothetical protein
MPTTEGFLLYKLQTNGHTFVRTDNFQLGLYPSPSFFLLSFSTDNLDWNNVDAPDPAPSFSAGKGRLIIPHRIVNILLT